MVEHEKFKNNPIQIHIKLILKWKLHAGAGNAYLRRPPEDMEDIVSEWVEEGGSGIGGQGGGAGISSYSSLLCLMDGTS